jgi:hypothetical protein
MKSAKFYRQAEAKGISMIGNSWSVSLFSIHPILINKCRIYKAKYNDEAEGEKSSESRPSHEKEKEKKPRNKSRTRTMFGRKKTANP